MRGAYHGQFGMVHTIAVTKNGRQIGFKKSADKKSYTAVIEDMYLHSDEWQELGEEYTDAIIKKAVAVNQLRMKKKQKGREVIYELAR